MSIIIGLDGNVQENVETSQLDNSYCMLMYKVYLETLEIPYYKNIALIFLLVSVIFLSCITLLYFGIKGGVAYSFRKMFLEDKSLKYMTTLLLVGIFAVDFGVKGIPWYIFKNSERYTSCDSMGNQESLIEFSSGTNLGIFVFLCIIFIITLSYWLRFNNLFHALISVKQK